MYYRHIDRRWSNGYYITSNSIAHTHTLPNGRMQEENSKVKLFRLCNFNLVLPHNIESDFGRQLAFTPARYSRANTHTHTHVHISNQISPAVIESKDSFALLVCHSIGQRHFFGCFGKFSTTTKVAVDWLFFHSSFWEHVQNVHVLYAENGNIVLFVRFEQRQSAET